MILGLVQGITEFLPISSSGHLVILQGLFGMSEPQVLFDVMLHAGTLAAILIVFRKDVVELVRAAIRIAVNRNLGEQPAERMLAAIAVGCVPTAFIGVVFSKQFERMFASTTAAGIGLLITGLVLIGTVWRSEPEADAGAGAPERVGLVHALLIGTAQGLAIVPGISRSGATIAVGLLLGVPRELAARFSFLLAVPAILGALAFELKGHSAAGNTAPASASMPAMLCGTLVAAVAGITALVVLLRVVKRGRIHLFAYYCWAVGLVAIALGIFKG